MNGFNNGGQIPAYGNEKTGKKIFTIANVRDITDQFAKEEISYSKMVELFNEVAENHQNNLHFKKLLNLCDKLILNYFDSRNCDTIVEIKELIEEIKLG